VPDLESEEDVGYFDDFSNEDDMAKYKEVYDKQLELTKLADRGEPLAKSAFVGFTFRYPPTPKHPQRFFEGSGTEMCRHSKGIVEKEKARGRQRGRADGTFGTMF
jgi:hypothetical protein